MLTLFLWLLVAGLVSFLLAWAVTIGPRKLRYWKRQRHYLGEMGSL